MTPELARDIRNLCLVWPDEQKSVDVGDVIWLKSRLDDVLQSQRHLMAVRHWSYDPARHRALIRLNRLLSSL